MFHNSSDVHEKVRFFVFYSFHSINTFTHVDRKSNILLESLLRKNTDHDADFQKQTEAYTKHKNNEHELAYDENKFIADCKLALEHTQALRQTAANSQLLRPEDYVRLESFLFNVINRSPSPNNSCDNRECSMVDIRCRHCFNQDFSSTDNRQKDSNEMCNNFKPSTSKFKLSLETKGFCSYVTFVASYVIFLFIVTFLLSRIGKI